MAKRVTGSTQGTIAGGGLLGATYWTKGTRLTGIYVRSFTTKYGQCDEFLLMSPPNIHLVCDSSTGAVLGKATVPDMKVPDGQEVRTLTRFSMGNLTGYEMALQDLKAKGVEQFRYQDRVEIHCTEVQPASQPDQSPMPMFEVSLERD